VSFSIKKKFHLSKVLEKIEIDRFSKETGKILDKYHSNPKSHVIGITGPPGVGKSSLINNLLKVLRKRDLTVGVIAIDPSSKKSGGALLGDRARFDIDPKDYNIYVRSMAAKDYLGGISELTFPSMIVMRSIFDILIIETVGVGQSEISIENLVDTVIFCVQPASGDSLQFMKSGIIEIPDIIGVTKSDLEDLSNNTISDLEGSKNYFVNESDWELKILSFSSKLDTGFEKLYEIISQRWNWLNVNRILHKKRYKQDIEWIKKTIINLYGTVGLSKLDSKIDYSSNPFSFLNKTRKKIKITFNESS